MESEHDLFTNIPSHIIIDILLRLDVRALTRCNCVCKSWLDLARSREFLKLYLSRSSSAVAPFLAFQSARHKFETLELTDDERVYNRYCKSIFNFPSRAVIHSSVNGLLFLCNDNDYRKLTYVMNPITREYFKVPAPSTSKYPVFGFGVSEVSGKYKIVRISQWTLFEKGSCEIITLGESSWRRIRPPCWGLIFNGWTRNWSHPSSTTALLNGKIHWLVDSVKHGHVVDKLNQISVFDFETEVFSSFPATPIMRGTGSSDSYYSNYVFYTISTLEGCLCLCLCPSYSGLHKDEDIDIWLMKEYGDDDSWTKVLSFRASGVGLDLGHVVPLKLFENGDMLMAVPNTIRLCYYSSKSKTTAIYSLRENENDTLPRKSTSNIVVYTPNFISPLAFLPSTH